MEQNTNLLINVINNITVTNTILISIAIIVGSVEITVLLNKGIIFLINIWKYKNAPYENDYYVYKDIVGKFNSITEETPYRRFESIEFLRSFSPERSIRSIYINHWNYLNNTEFKKIKYKFKNKNLERKKDKLFKALDEFNLANTRYLDATEKSADFLELPQIHKNSNLSEDRKKEAIVDINSFCKSVSKLVEAYDDFVIACDDKFNFPIDKTPEERF